MFILKCGQALGEGKNAGNGKADEALFFVFALKSFSNVKAMHC
jgi:hypothetical protein